MGFRCRRGGGRAPQRQGAAVELRPVGRLVGVRLAAHLEAAVLQPAHHGNVFIIFRNFL